ncbi:hypothetical protein QTI51_34890 [Variovorax sp. J22G73]|uniref:hypothetical protein n=1 Tax=unclassified Variovorax TaxID=663243 RepID=UPI002575B8D2|nr:MULTISPECIES: hypothetical protein [unclassified Variovorax]MDM0010000.1 hypothetical protein [Variovorax sp. J22R203]MDM0102508.1 hypothetical protein [Variovorax sp. J22G73]
MQDRRRLIELIQSLSRQESTRQPTAEQWLREQDEKKARNGVPDTAADDPMKADDPPDNPVA